jgi:hypothetical protein
MDWKSSAKWVLEVLAFLLVGRFFDEAVTFFLAVVNQAPLPSTIDIIFGIIGIGVITVAIGLAIHGIWGITQRKKYEPFYVILFFPKSVSYKRGERTPTSKELRYKYFVDGRINTAYYMTEYATDLLLKRKIQWYSETDQGEEKNKQLLTSKGIKLDPKPATRSVLLGQKPTILLAEHEGKPDLVSKLKGHRLDDLQIIFVFPRIYWFFPFLERWAHFPPSKRLLLKFSTKEAFSAPSQSIELVKNGIIDSDRWRLQPRDSLDKLCKRYGFTFKRKRYPESELTRGL